MKRSNIRKRFRAIVALVMVLTLIATNLGSSVSTVKANADGWSSTNTNVNKGTSDHIDISIQATATLEVENETLTQTVTLANTDFNGSTGTVSLSATWKGEEFTSYTFDTDDLSTSTYTEDNQTIQQIRIGGSYPVGTIDYPVTYYITMTKEVTFTATSGNTYTVTMSFTSSFAYWDEDNCCDGLNAGNQGGGPGQGGQGQQQGQSWSDGDFIQGSGLDFKLTATAAASSITIYKYVNIDDKTLLTDDTTGTNSEVSTQTYTFNVYSYDETTNTSSLVQTVTITPSSDGMGSYTFTLSATQAGYYYVVETTPTAAIGDYDYNTTTTSAYRTDYDSNGNGTAGTASTTDTTTSAIVQVDDDSSATYTFNNYYGEETIDVTATKVWDTDVYGLQPDSISVVLMKGTTVYDTQTLSGTDWSYTWTDLPVSTDGVANNWWVEEVAVDGYDSSIAYTTDSNGNITAIITNTLNVGRLAITKTVVGDVDTTDLTFTFTVSGFDTSVTSVTDTAGNTWAVTNGVATVTVAAGATVTLINVPEGVTYTVTETGSSASSWTTTVGGVETDTTNVTVAAGETATAAFSNTITGDATVYLTKIWDDQSDKYGYRPDNDGTSFTVTLTATNATDGNTYTKTTDAVWSEASNTWTYSLADVPAYDKNGTKLTYSITEIFTNSGKYTMSGDTTITPADDPNATITNTLNTTTVNVYKVVKDSEGNTQTSTENDDDFRFILYMYDESGNAVQIGEAQTVYAGGEATFTNVPLGATVYLTEYLVGTHVHSYNTTVSVDGTDVSVTENYGYSSLEGQDIKTHTVSFEVKDTGSTVEVTVTNQEESISVDLTALVNGTKTLTGEDQDLTFTYTVKEASVVNSVMTEGDTVATGTASVTTVGSVEDIAWTILDSEAFTYTDVGTYYYVIYEDVDTGIGGVVWDATRYTLIITVTQDTDGGGLVATASMTKNVQNSDGSRTTTTMTSDTEGDTSIVVAIADTTSSTVVSNDTFTAAFTNQYNEQETSIILRATKVLSGRTLETGEFTLVVQELNDSGEYVTLQTRTNGATGAFGFEIVYTEAGTHTYKIYEQDDGKGGVTYDDSYYIVTVTVEKINNVLTVTGTTTTYYTDNDGDGIYEVTTSSADFQSMTFSNTYKASGTGTLSTYKVMDGRSFVAGETFTFTITALDSSAPDLTSAAGVTSFTDNGDGTYTVTVTVTESMVSSAVINGQTYSVLKFDLATITADQDDATTSVFRINETSASITNGMTLDSGEYGRLVTVTVTDDKAGNLTVETSSTNDTDWNGDGTTDSTAAVIMNTFDPGNRTIYGTKVWVDGGQTHTNSDELTLTLYYSTNGGTTWTAWKSNGDGTYSVSGSGAYYVEWGQLNTDRWHIENLPVYDTSGNVYIYKVVEDAVSGYSTTYDSTDDDDTDAEAVPDSNSASERYTITNTINQDYMTISGTKTWIEPADVNGDAPEHDNSVELKLTVTRNSDGTSLEELTEVSGTGSFDSNGDPVDGTYIVVWSSDGTSYNIYWYQKDGTYVGLPLYDSLGYAWRYSVAETFTDAYATQYEDYETATETTVVSDTAVTFDFTNSAPDEEEEKPEKTAEVSTTNADGKPSVDDEITYTISYYNNTNDTVNVTIVDELDSGVDYVSGSASDGGVYDSSTHTVTWTIEKVAAFTRGEVTVTVKVNESARTPYGSDSADVVNTASVQIGNKTAVDTEPVETILEDDDPTDPTKDVDIAATVKEGWVLDGTYDNGVVVNVGDTLIYYVNYTNHYNATATVTITDVLDDGVTYSWSSQNSVITDESTGTDSDGNTYSYGGTVTWTLTVPAYGSGTVRVAVIVNENAKTLATGETVASVENDADVKIVANDSTYEATTNPVENPLDDDDPVDPTKTISASSGYGYDADAEIVIDTTNADDKGTLTGASVAVGDIIEYVITYYNNNNEPATVTITDTLDPGVEFVKASDGGTCKDGVVTWTIENAPALSYGTVTLEVQVTSDAKKTVSGETSATVDNTASVQIGVENAVETNVVINPIDPDDPDTPEKVVSSDSAAGDNGSAVKVGDEITYVISYTNHDSNAGTVIVTDVLEDGLTFVSASGEGAAVKVEGETTGTDSNGTSYSYGGTVTWTIEDVPSFGTGVVYLTVKVNENAEAVDTGDTEADVDNDASVTVAGNTAYTEVVTNVLEDEDPVDPTKTAAGSTGIENKEAKTITYDTVSVDEEITYEITYYNNLNEAATVTITDPLDEGVDYISSTGGGVYDQTTHTVTWIITDVAVFSGDSVTLTVKVNENAKTVADDETQATVENTASVQIADNEAVATYTVIHPITPDDPVDPEKTIVETDATTGEAKYLVDGSEVSVSDIIEYDIAYYNNNNETATVTIVDELDPGVDFVSASDGGVYDAAKHTVTWTLENVAPFTAGSVTLNVQVNADAKTVDAEDNGSAKVQNDATVTIGELENGVTTNTVVNPVSDDDPEDPTKIVAADSTAGVEGATVSVGDEITYEISYYNNNSSAATVTIVDALDKDVEFVSATDGGEYDATTHTVTWTVSNVDAYTYGYVELTVEVLASALSIDDGEEIADVDNIATVQIGNDPAVETNPVNNPLNPEDPEDPVKTEISAEDGTEESVTISADGTRTYGEVTVGTILTYEIEYYNNYNEATTVTITDELDPGVSFVAATGVAKAEATGTEKVIYDVTTENGVTTVTWTIAATALERDSVILQVEVTEAAKTVDAEDGGSAAVSNEATMTVGEVTNTSNVVVNPVADDEPGEPTKVVSAESAAGVAGEGVTVGSEITYLISYYNHYSSQATVEIVDVLDPGVELVSASGTLATEAAGNETELYTVTTAADGTVTVTWTVDVAAYTEGYVTLIVRVTEDALVVDAEDGDSAAVQNDATVTVGEVTNDTNVVVNPVNSDEPEDPVKTVVVPGTGEEANVEVGADGTRTYEEVAVGTVLVYDIAYYNNNNTEATVVITDVLDEGVDFVSASEGSSYDEATRTVTWTLTVPAFTHGSVVLEVEVNASAKDTEIGETSATVENQATVTVGEVENETNVVVNPITDDDPEEPTKAVTATSEAGVEGDAASVGEEITYVIGYYNHESETVTVTITDELDPGVDFVYATGVEASEAKDGDTIVYEVTTAADGTVTVTWTITDVAAFATGNVTLAVEVNENAKLVEDDEDAATVENTASVKIGNNTAVNTNKVETPLDPDDPVDPEKTEVVPGTGEEKTDVTEAADGTKTYEEVGIGSILVYDISYYNNNNTRADVVITDVLDPGVDLVSATGTNKADLAEGETADIVYEVTTDADGIITVTWTISGVAPFTGGSVVLEVEVNANAKLTESGETEATVENQAIVTIAEVENDTNVVVNPITDDIPEDPTKAVAAGSEAGVEGDAASVGEEITYVISYYNHESETVTVTITDELDEGVDFVSASDEGIYDKDAHTVTWIITDIDAFTSGFVTLTVAVNENAKVTETDEDEATVENTASVQIGNNSVVDTNTVETPLDPDDPEDPVKTEMIPGAGEEKEDVTISEDGTRTYEEVTVGTILLYDITYYNNNNTEATVVITDALDDGVDYVSASDNGEYDEATHTVTWTLTVDAFTGGSVVLEVEVNANAKETTEGETVATVENQATVSVAGVENVSNIVVNPISPDEPDNPTKVVDATSEAGVEGDGASVGEQITYVISYYNHNNEESTVEIIDELDEGVDFISASGGGVYDENTHTVTWTITGVDAFANGFVTVTVEVNENAKQITVGEVEATVENVSEVTIVEIDHTAETNIVITPINSDDPEEPVKTITESSASGYYDENGEPAVTVGEDGTVTGADVGVGGIIEYEITYYNHTNQATTVTITDELDPGVMFVSANGVEVEDASALDTSIDAVGYDYVTYTVVTTTDANGDEVTTVIWTIYNATPFAYGSVELQVEVVEDAKTLTEGETTATVENEAEVVIAAAPENTYTTNIVVNEVDDENPGDPVKVITADSEAGVDGATVEVGDEITYAISYYNHTNSVADVVITDALDPGVAFVYASNGGVYDEETHTVTWNISDVTAYTGGFVILSVEVTEVALVLDEGDTSADVENQATVTVGDVTNSTDIIVNLLDAEEPAEPAKYVSPDSAAGSEVVSVDEDGNITYETVGVGDRITYEIEYYNHHNDTATIEIIDELDEGVTFISASDDGVYDEETHTVTWTLTAAAYTGGIVTVIVEVDDDAKQIETDETVATVENDAVVTISVDNDTATYTTDLVIHPVDPDDPVDPSKTVISDAGSAGDAVAVGDEVTYEIVYYNYNNVTADVTVTDVLDPGVTFVTASGVLASEATEEDTVIYEVTTDEDGNVTVTWTITGVAPYTTGSVTLTVEVNENARTIEDGETQATIENTASVQIGNDAAVDTNTTENPVTPDDPVDPTKTITTDGVAEGDEVAVGDELTYEITYYNHTNEVATVVITDVLDEGTDFVTASDDYVYDADTHTVIWTLTVAPFTGGSVTVTVEVNDSAVTQVENTASVQVGNEDAVDTNTVENPVEEVPEETTTEAPTEEETTTATPTETEKIPTTSDTEAVVPYTILMLMAFMAIVVLLKGRKREQA